MAVPSNSTFQLPCAPQSRNVKEDITPRSQSIRVSACPPQDTYLVLESSCQKHARSTATYKLTLYFYPCLRLSLATEEPRASSSAVLQEDVPAASPSKERPEELSDRSVPSFRLSISTSRLGLSTDRRINCGPSQNQAHSVTLSSRGIVGTTVTNLAPFPKQLTISDRAGMRSSSG
ncbi:hypothetical protein BDN67DRAFT_428592 [Paxillus ammoniavirescens]|nr:hypothetical protein BDN67DRAFT_428592 [Paxillus ammoniavirescens]